jgi:hypothetical protein
LLDVRLSLPEDWARDPQRRQACHIPEEVHYHTRQEQCLEMLDLWGAQVPHGWVVGDDELGCDLTGFVADRRLIIWRQTSETLSDYVMR